MPLMNGEGPKIQGLVQGRRLGHCNHDQLKDISLLGKGRGLRCNAGGGVGKGKRLRYNLAKNEDCRFNR